MKKKIAFLGALAACVTLPSVAHAKVYAQVAGGIDHVEVGDLSDDGGSLGVALGYEHMLGKKAFVAIESTIDVSNSELCATNMIALGDNGCFTSRWDSSLVAKLGTSVSEKAEVYVLGGSAAREFRYTGFGDPSLTDRWGFDGWRAGAGVKLKLSGNLFAKAEYRYSDYEAGFSSSNGVLALGTTF